MERNEELQNNFEAIDKRRNTTDDQNMWLTTECCYIWQRKYNRMKEVEIQHQAWHVMHPSEQCNDE